MILAGVVPLTPLVLLLALFKISITAPFHLAFWRVQAVGIILVAAGAGLLLLARQGKAGRGWPIRRDRVRHPDPG